MSGSPINISAVQFSKGNLFDLILCALVETGLSPERLELEITETVAAAKTRRRIWRPSGS